MSAPASPPSIWRIVAQETRLLAGHWRKPTRDVPALPVLRAGAPLILVGALIVVAAFELDVRVTLGARELPQGLVRIFRVLTALGTSGWMFAAAALTAAAALLLRQRRGKSLSERAGLMALAQRSAYVLATLAVTGLTTQLVKHVVGRARPALFDQYGAFHFNGLEFRASLASFPSGHTSMSFALVVALGAFLPRLRVPLLALAALIALSRAAVGAHYPSDIIAGAYIGVAAAIVVARAFARRGVAFVWRDGRVQARGPGMVAAALSSLRRAAAKGSK